MIKTYHCIIKENRMYKRNNVPTSTKFSEIEYLGLLEYPFDYQLDIRFFFSAPSRTDILFNILRQSNKTAIRFMVSGETRMGKTALSMKLSHLLEIDDEVLPMTYSPRLTNNRDQSLQFLMQSLGLKWMGNFDESLQHIKNAIIIQSAEQSPLFLIFHQMKADISANIDTLLSEILKLKHNGQPACHFVWFTHEKPQNGKYQIMEFINDYEILNPFKGCEMNDMINFRCQVAGRIRPLFSKEVFDRIYHYTYGNPGETLKLCGFVMDEMVQGRRKSAGIEDVDAAWKRWII